MSVLAIIIYSSIAYFLMIVLTYYALVRFGVFENSFDEFARTMASIFWPLAGPFLAFLAISALFEFLKNIGESRRRKSQYRKRSK